MKHLIKTLFLLMTFLASMTLGHATVSAAELSQTDVIDSIQFSDSTLSQGHSTSVKVTFSEKNKNQINPGDSITLSLPPSLQGMVENDGAPRRVQLSNLGEALIYSNRVVATFNENVATLNNVSGHFSFGIKATVSNKTQDEIISTNFGTKVVSQNITIPGHFGNTGNVGQKPFFYKTGDLLGKSNTVRWFLNANLNKEELHNYILITDTHGVGQTLDKDSFQITVDNYLGRFSYSLPDFIAKRLGSIRFTADNTFEVYIPREVARLASFSISYTTTMTEAGKKQKDFENSYTLNYQPWNKPVVTEKNTFKVKNLFAEGDAQGDKDLIIVEEKEEIIPEETVDSIEEVVTDNATESVVENNTDNSVEISQPEINVPVTEENITEETTESIDEVITDNATESVVENNTDNSVEISQPEINVPVTEENVTEETTETIEEVVTDNANESTVEDDTNNSVEITQPEINVPVTEENITEETTESIDEVITDNPTESVVENNTDNSVEISQPEINVPVTEENITEETTESIDEVVTDNANGSVVENNTDNSVEINQPEINVPVTEENITEETTESIDEVVTDNATESVVENNTDNSVEISQPNVIKPIVEKTDISNTQQENNLETTVVKTASSQNKENALPKTGETNSNLLAILGLLLSSAVFFKIYLQRNQSANN
ncbi:collagen binding domain-containing protein [uncultured Vagococcus sp.]|uniref:collagen binding domain-containing protein n=1 Tax=uncultured Vagococcus sp. TaxID=189676 RepID=UPI002582EAB7|nr:collagen binding domain-containing protein [uncultured Vagococcus sp.]